ncbi:MAG: NAD+ synthase [Gammaproteobacteria bacterium]|nr:NAD+ synthase [Gammaproteobacteria bacterium]
MSDTLKIVLAQLNLKVGDLHYNLKKHEQAALTARDELHADIIVFSELSLTGYSPEDLLFRPAFIQATEDALRQLLATITGIHCVVGHPQKIKDKLFNACTVFYNGQILGVYQKQVLPNYSIFDEYRYFSPGSKFCIVEIKNIPIGLCICEDLWVNEPVKQACQNGARLILSPNASPFELNKPQRRLATIRARAQDNKVPILYANQVGGQDELIFDGGSMAIDATGTLFESASFFQEALLPITFTLPTLHHQNNDAIDKNLSMDAAVYQALVLGVKDYVEKNNFKDVLIGLSGGIDSALTTTIAVDALGPHRVRGILMPSRFTAEISNQDALLLAKNLGIETQTISIEPTYEQFLATLATHFQNHPKDATEENIQARIRAIILMAFSNKFGSLVLSTGNRSELAVGYCTLYGDMAGGFAVLKDIPKTLVYQLTHFRNQLNDVIPERIITRPPTAELAFNQRDEDSLPPYPILDEILKLYLNHEKSIAEIIAAGFNESEVNKVVNLIRKNEYKRRQAAIGPRINYKAFGRDRRYPVVNGYKG